MGLPARNPELLVIQFRGARRRQNAPNATAGAARGALRAVGLPAQQLRQLGEEGSYERRPPSAVSSDAR